jgi:lycopene cyclase CruA
MKELLYLEIPTPNTLAVRTWLQEDFKAPVGTAIATVDGLRLEFRDRPSPNALPVALSVFVWSLQRSTYLKAYRWGDQPLPQESRLVQALEQQIRQAFPPTYPTLPPYQPDQETIFEALADHCPKTVTYFQRMPNGEADLERVYWWEKRWRDSVRSPQAPKQVIFRSHDVPSPPAVNPDDDPYDLIYCRRGLGRYPCRCHGESGLPCAAHRAPTLWPHASRVEHFPRRVPEPHRSGPVYSRRI